jgi:hypothetical protein
MTGFARGLFLGLMAVAPSAIAAGELVLGSAGSTQRLEAVAGPCHEGVRKLRIQRVPHGETMKPATVPPDWEELPCGLSKSEDRAWDWAGGDVETSAATAELSSSVAIKSVDLKGGPTALLVTVQKGFEQVRRTHALFIPGAEGVTRIWVGVEGQWPTGSTVQVHDGGLLFARTFVGNWEEAADTWALTQVRWDAGKKKMVERSASGWGVILATSDSLDAAKAARKDLATRCEWGDLLAVSTDAFPRLKPGKWVVARFFPFQREAETEQRKVRACVPDAYARRVQ